MPQEIERKFLVADDRWRDASDGDGTEIVQGYLHVDDDVEIRVRLRGPDGEGDAVLTVKRGGSAKVRSETEVPLGRDEARRLLAEAAIGTVVTKRRHRVDLPHAGDHDLTAELDEFGGELDGLVVVEVELPDPDAPLPDVGWFGEEVTGDERYYNAALAVDGPPD